MAQEQTHPVEIAQKRQVVLDQAVRTFAEVGFRRADVQVIADRAGVGKGTVYRYFGNKEDLFWAATYSVLERLKLGLEQAMQDAENPRGKLRAAGMAYANFFETNPLYLEIIVQDRAEFRGSAPEKHLEYHERMIDSFARIVEEGVTRGQFRPVDARSAVYSLGAIFYGAMVFQCYCREHQTLVETTLHTLDIFLDGLAAASPQPECGDASQAMKRE